MRKFTHLLLLAFCFGLIACTEIFFSHKATGRIPDELAGNYYLEYEEKEGQRESLFFSIEQIRAGVFEFQLPAEGDSAEEPMQLEIVARGNDYFINWPDEDYEDKWHITSFRLIGDSAYNFMEAMVWTDYDDFEVERYFKHFEKEIVEEDHTRYFVDNRRRETLKAFRAYNDKAVAEGRVSFLQKIETVPAVGAPPSSSYGQLQVGPNPFRDQLKVYLPPQASGRLTILDIQGKVLRTREITTATLTWPLLNLSPGIYFLQWKNTQNGDIQTVRIIRES